MATIYTPLLILPRQPTLLGFFYCMDLNQLVNPELPESHFPNLQSGQVMGWIPATVTDLNDPKGLGRIRVKIDLIDPNTSISNLEDGWCWVGERYTCNEREGGSHRLLQTGTLIAAIPMLGDMRQLLLVDCLPNGVDRPNPDFNRYEGKHGETTPGGVTVANDDTNQSKIEAYPHGVVKSISGEGDVQTSTAGGARSQLTRNGDARIESPKAFLHALENGDLSVANGTGAGMDLQANGNVGMKSAFGSGVTLGERGAVYTGPLSEASDAVKKARNLLMGNIGRGLRILEMLEEIMGALNGDEADPQLASSAINNLLDRLEGYFSTDFEQGIETMVELAKLSEKELGRTVGDQIGQAYDINLAAIIGVVQGIVGGGFPPSSLIAIREKAGKIIAESLEKVFTYFPSRLRRVSAEMYLSAVTRDEAEQWADEALSGNPSQNAMDFITRILEGEPGFGTVMSAIEQIKDGDPGYDDRLKKLGKAIVPAVSAAFGVTVKVTEEIELSDILSKLGEDEKLVKELAASLNIEKKDLQSQLGRGVALSNLRARLKEVVPAQLVETGTFPSKELRDKLKPIMEGLKHDPKMQVQVLVSECVPKGFESVKNLLGLDVASSIKVTKKPWAILRPGEIESTKDKEEIIEKIGKQQKKLCQEAVGPLVACKVFVKLIPTARLAIQAVIRSDVEQLDWSMEQVKKLLPENEIKIDSVKAIAESACRPLISQMKPKLTEALKKLQPLINAIPDNFHATSFEISEASGEIVAAGKNVGGRLVLNATQGAMFSPNGKSSVFAAPKDMGMKLGKENAFNVHHDADKKDGDGLEEAWQTNFNKGSIATRNSEPKVKSAGWVMDRKGEYKVASYPEIEKNEKFKFDLHKAGLDWKGQTSEMGVSEKKMGAKTFIDEIAQSAFGMESSDALKGGITSLETFKEGLPQTMMRFAANEALGAGGVATLQSIREGKPEAVLDLIGGKIGEAAKAAFQTLKDGNLEAGLEFASGLLGDDGASQGAKAIMQTLKDGKPEALMQFAASQLGAGENATSQGAKALMQTLKDGKPEALLEFLAGDNKEDGKSASTSMQTLKDGKPETKLAFGASEANKPSTAMMQTLKDDKPETNLSFSAGKEGEVAKAEMQTLKDGTPETNLSFSGGKEGQPAKATMQTLKDGIPETQLDLASGQGTNKAVAGLQTFKSGLPETFSGIKGGVAMFQSFIDNPLSKLSFAGIAGMAMDAYLGANPQAALAIQGGKMLMQSLDGGKFELGDKLKFGGFGGGGIEVGNEININNALGAMVKVGSTVQMISPDGGNLEISNIVKIGGRDIISDILSILDRLSNAGL